MSTRGFYAYASSPNIIGETIEAAIGSTNLKIHSWRAMDILGHFISEEVFSNIDSSDFLVADISILNFNVTYEIGYAIGKHKRVILTKNKSIKDVHPTIREVGIFDTLGYQQYANTQELIGIIKSASSSEPLKIPEKLNMRSPVYLLESFHKTDDISHIVSRIKKAGYLFRTFDPAEQPRLSASDAIKQVSESYGVIIPLLQKYMDGSAIHNMRAAFLAGLAFGMDKPLLILQNGDDPVPMDYQELVSSFRHPKDIDKYIADFVPEIAKAFQEESSYLKEREETVLQSLDLGATSAENEMRTLMYYYLRTDQYLKALRGDAKIVIGRKGTGKSAIFLQIRDQERNKNGQIVLDLKPDGYKLIKFKERILSFLEEGSFQHTIMAFWEYVLLLEICFKILEKDKEKHVRDDSLIEPYRRLSELYHAENYSTEGDFSERMGTLIERIASDFRSKYGESNESIRLSAPQITELLYCHDVKKLITHLKQYLIHKEGCWLLFDNLDKGWPTSGLQHEDLLIIRALIDATQKIEKHFDKSNIIVNTILFLRNDVYELLVQETSDKGKEANVLLDWSEPDLLRELLRLRICSNFDGNEQFKDMWSRICVSHYKGEESSQYLITNSLMRPRFLLNLINQCKGFAINLNHSKIEEEDITKGLSAYSTDLITDIGYEINDIEGGDDILYAFISSNSILTKEEIIKLLLEYDINQDRVEKIFQLLLWYGFLGVRFNSEEKYIYDFNYNMKLLSGVIKKHEFQIKYIIHRAFWPALIIEN